MSEVKTDKLSPRTASGTVTLGTSGDTFTIPLGVTLTNNGSSFGFDGGLASVQTFTSSGTWTKPSGITKVIVEVQGAGGGGGYINHGGNNGGAGGGGGYSKKLIDVSSISTATITVGSAGSLGNSGARTGVAGGNSVWSDGTNTVTGGGGSGGSGSGSNARHRGGDGGTASGGDLNISGQAAAWSGIYRDKAGDSVLGKGRRIDSPQVTDFVPSTGYGGGGLGGDAGVTQGGSANGIVIVTEYK